MQLSSRRGTPRAMEGAEPGNEGPDDVGLRAKRREPFHRDCRIAERREPCHRLVRAGACASESGELHPGRTKGGCPQQSARRCVAVKRGEHVISCTRDEG